MCQYRKKANEPRRPSINRASNSRIIDRDGKIQICLDQISLGKKKRYLWNPFNTFLTLQWRWIITVFAIGFLVTWLSFAVIYYAIAWSNGDIGDTDENKVPCFNSVNSFTAAFLFSLETQHTIGYGSRNPTSQCSVAVLMVFAQFIIGMAVQCVTAGLVVAKLQLGKRTSKALVFSERACIGMCNNNVCLMVRIGNAGKSELVNVKGFGVVIERHEINAEDEILSESIIDFVSENGSESLNLLWPAVIHCQITESPLKFIKKMKSPNTELIVIIEGTLESTGQNAQLRTSYLAHEIEIGMQFTDISPQLVKTGGRNAYHHTVDYADFDNMQPDEQWAYEEVCDRNEVTGHSTRSNI